MSNEINIKRELIKEKNKEFHYGKMFVSKVKHNFQVTPAQ